MMAVEGGYQWLHPATVMQAVMEGINYNGFHRTVNALTLVSATPLHDTHVRKALTHLYRKEPVLRLCFRHREGMLWACYMAREDIDFQVVEGKDAAQVMEELESYPYNVSEGPLWCARLLPEEENPSTPRTELQDAFPHVRTLILANNHAMSDETTNAQNVNFLLQILNDVLSGKDVDDSLVMQKYEGAEVMDELLFAHDKELRGDVERLEIAVKHYNDHKQQRPVMSKILPPIQDLVLKTKSVDVIFDKDTTRKFITRCKEEGITVNSGIVALLNVTLVDYMREAGVMQEEYAIKSSNAVNMRRYLPSGMSAIPGLHMTLFRSTMHTPGQWRGSFWDYAKRIHREIYEGLESYPVTALCLVRMTLYNKDTFREAYSKASPPRYDYTASSIGNLDLLIPDEGDHVRLGHLVRLTTNSYEAMMHMYQSFRGRLLYSLSYSDGLLSRESAQRLVDLFVENLKSQLDQ